MNTYPYYIPVRFEAGILQKIFTSKKFNSVEEAEQAMLTRNAKPVVGNFLNKYQVLILEYSEQYKGKICVIYNFGKRIEIINSNNI